MVQMVHFAKYIYRSLQVIVKAVLVLDETKGEKRLETDMFTNTIVASKLLLENVARALYDI